MKKEVLLRLDGITKIFPGTKALNGISLEVGYAEIHAIIGENGAGKSTLMNIIAGVFPPEEGTMGFEGRPIKLATPLDAQKAGIGIVHQEINLCPDISVAENIFIGRLPKSNVGMIDFKKLVADSARLLKEFNSSINPKSKVCELTIAQQQIVEIVKALSMNCKLLILDEPTSSLTETETQDLFNVIRRLKSDGISVLYISHRLSEIVEICDRISVLRDGEYIGSETVADIDTEKMIAMMVGRTISNIYPAKSETTTDEPLLEVIDVSFGNQVRNASFMLKKGEILGFSGLVGAGRTELARAVCGIEKKSGGEVKFCRETVRFRNYKEAIEKGIIYITENRKLDGLFLDCDIKQNIIAACLGKMRSGLFLNSAKETKFAVGSAGKIKVKCSSVKQLCSSLSGGNQQKVLLAKYLALDPKILIVDEPTRGIDVGIRLEIYNMLRALCDEGVGIIVISSDLSEVIGLCDRVVVMKEGQISGELDFKDINEESIMRLASL